MATGVEAVDDGIGDAGGAVDDVEGGMELMFAGLALGDVEGVFVGDPAGVHAVHVDAVVEVFGGGGAGHHVEGGLGHVGVGMTRGLESTIELPFDGGDIDDVFVEGGHALKQGFQPGIDEERGDGIDQLDFEEFDGRHLGQGQAPGIASTEIDLLEVAVELAGGEQFGLAFPFLGKQGEPGKFGGIHEAGDGIGTASENGSDGAFGMGGTAEGFIGTEELTCGIVHRPGRGQFTIHHVGIEIGRAPDGLAGVVDDEIETVARGNEMGAEGLDTGGVAEIEPEDLKTVAPFGEVGFLGITFGGIAGEPGGDDQACAAAQEFESGLVPDLDAAAGEQGDPAAQVGELGAFEGVEVTAFGAELVVEVMDLGEVAFADVAAVGFLEFGALGGDETGWRGDVGRGEDGIAAELTDGGLVELGLFTFDLGEALAPGAGAADATTDVGVGVEDLAGDTAQAGEFLGGQGGEEGRVSDGFLQGCNG